MDLFSILFVIARTHSQNALTVTKTDIEWINAGSYMENPQITCPVHVWTKDLRGTPAEISPNLGVIKTTAVFLILVNVPNTEN